MSKQKRTYYCTSCKATQALWSGACASCGEAGTLEETMFSKEKITKRKSFSSSSGFSGAASLSDSPQKPPRQKTGSSEFDRVLGGGLVDASAILIGGDPGVGKSTLLLQLAARMSEKNHVVYVSGEETIGQVQLRGRRLGLEKSPVRLVATMDAVAVTGGISSLEPGSLVIIDSLQTMDSGEGGTPGGVAQVKASATMLVGAAKEAGVTLILVNHVAKDGTLAGPNLIKHMVDATLHLESDHASGVLRLLRASKNRFGAADEVGVFRMVESGMEEVTNPSEILIGERDINAHGVTIFPSMDGSRPLLLEVQALVGTAAYGSGRRTSTGWDTNRLHMLLAVIQTRLGISMQDQDVFINVAGGIKVSEPAMDLAVAAAVLSSRTGIPLDPKMAFFGEVGLGGEVRSVVHTDLRLREAAKLGFDKIIAPGSAADGAVRLKSRLYPMHRLMDLVSILEGSGNQ